ncbi:MAG: recombinase RecB [Sulfuricurvum sp. PD_MW2]|uniref:RecB-like helicase n=1 Tax=Sulfuricurvum sp. PD_MW2 TaxID=2027917 RepID=UPI000C063CDB|nr:RecB-like helicase [Sulfuricurvum sp. PD_MW2]PHM18306.1 MAG: recombinase RecB [Sulfuricurvum sp. PD_MW2]
MEFEPFLAYEASAGSGKTFNLVVRYLSLLFMGENPSSIVALTFTNKAANEMLERIIQTLEELPTRSELPQIARLCGMSEEAVLEQRKKVLSRFLRSDVQIATLDKFFGRILRKFALNAGVMPTFKTVQSHHEIALLERFLNEVEVSNASNALVHLSILSDKRLSDLFGLLSALYSKYKEIDLESYAGMTPPEDSSLHAFELAQELSALVLSKPISDRARKTMQFESYEELLEKTWLFKPSMEYWDFKKSYEPRMDELLHAIQNALASTMRRREILYFKELFSVLKLYIKSRQSLAMQTNALSFDDITLNVHTLLREKLESDFLYFRLDSRLKHLLLDEFQDTSVIQFDILRPLIEEIRSGVGVNEGGSFFFVGDVKQSIYRFRGGVSALFHQVAELFDVKVEPLKVNYRSKSEIVDFVNRVFEGKIKGYTPQQTPPVSEGGYVEVLCSDDLLVTLSERIATLIEAGVAPEEIAILTATNKDGSAVEEALSERGYDVVTETTARLISQRSVRAIIEYLRYCYFGEMIYRSNCAALLGVSSENIERRPVDEVISAVIAFVKQFKIADKSALMFIEALRSYRDIEEVVFEIDRLESTSPQSDLRGIRIMTVHKSKGLEFEHVIVLDRLGKGRNHNDPIVYEYEGAVLHGMHYRIINRQAVDPVYAKALEAEQKAADEDQLNALYVALTRAVLSLSVIAKTKNSWFDPLELTPSAWGKLEITPHQVKPALIQEPLNFQALRFGRQEESTRSIKESTHDYAAVQFGLALHYTLEMMGEFSPHSLSSALESTRNRYGAVVGSGAIQEIEKRVGCLIGDKQFCTLIAGQYYKEQMVRHNGNIGVIDLLVQHNDGWIIIDYKSGREEEEKHREQIGRYADAIRTLKGGNVQGYLCYLIEDRVEWVKCL